MTVEELLARITSRELTEWAVFEQECGPLGLERGDWQAALVAQATAGDKGSKLSDFVMTWGRKKRQSAQEQLAIFRALASRGEAGPDEHDSQPPDQGGDRHQGR